MLPMSFYKLYYGIRTVQINELINFNAECERVLEVLHIFAHPAYVLCHLYFRSSVLEKAKQNVEAAQEKQKADYNK